MASIYEMSRDLFSGLPADQSPELAYQNQISQHRILPLSIPPSPFKTPNSVPKDHRTVNPVNSGIPHIGTSGMYHPLPQYSTPNAKLNGTYRPSNNLSYPFSKPYLAHFSWRMAKVGVLALFT
jgi:hypothetical protein